MRVRLETISEGNTKRQYRYVELEELEATYAADDTLMITPIELDIKNGEIFAILQLTTDRAELKLHEGMVNPQGQVEGDETGQVLERVVSIKWRDGHIGRAELGDLSFVLGQLEPLFFTD